MFLNIPLFKKKKKGEEKGYILLKKYLERNFVWNSATIDRINFKFFFRRHLLTKKILNYYL